MCCHHNEYNAYCPHCGQGMTVLDPKYRPADPRTFSDYAGAHFPCGRCWNELVIRHDGSIDIMGEDELNIVFGKESA